MSNVKAEILTSVCVLCSRSMFLRQLSSLGPSLFPQSRSALGSVGFRSNTTSSTAHYVHHLPPAPPFYPWCTARGPHRPHPPLRPPRFIYSGRVFGANHRAFCSTNGLRMERPDRLREPPQKRKKSEEERQKGTSSKTENREERTSCHYKERHWDLGDKNPPGKHFSRENSSEKDEERTKKSGEAKNQGRTLHKHTQTSGAKSEGHDGRDTAEESQSSNPCQVRAEGIASTQAQPAVSTKRESKIHCVNCMSEV